MAWQGLTLVEEDQSTTVLVVSKHVQPVELAESLGN
jgi:hypothetical protein